jgi:hypothetical protein
MKEDIEVDRKKQTNEQHLKSKFSNISDIQANMQTNRARDRSR